MRRLFVFIFVLLGVSGFTQSLSNDEISSFKTEGQQLVSYLEFTLNAIGDNELSPKEKDIIISESFLKMFRDDKVQIEDDLDDSRETVTNKDVQAYLKDVDFFFQKAQFTFNILAMDVQIDENGQPFLLTNVLRTLDAIDLKGDSIHNDQQRFIEIELNSDRRELKIASIYTTKLNENEENIRWWNLLPEAWKKVLGTRAILFDSIPFSSINQLNTEYLVLDPLPNSTPPPPTDSLAMQQATDAVFLYKYDTLWLNDTSKIKQKETVFKALNHLLEMNDLNISGNTDIVNLEPLSKLSQLRTLNVSSTQIQDIYPVRNLTKLHNLNASNTFIQSLDALVYSMELAALNVSNTQIRSIEPLANISNLKILDISNTPVDSLQACYEMKLLEDLKMRNTLVTDLSPIQQLNSLSYLDISNNQQIKSLEALSGLQKLKVLYCNNTMINDLSPLAGLSNLETLYCENAEITSLDGLQHIPNLKKVYCDNSLLGRQKAIEFMKAHPQILVVYETKQLKMWWDELPVVWKNIFRKMVELDSIPTKEQLHELTTLTDIDISGEQDIKSLLPLEKLKSLQKLNASSTAIQSLDGIAEAREMRSLNIAHTAVQHLYAMENLNLMENLSLAGTSVRDLYPLKGLVNLKTLNIDSTQANNLAPLEELHNLRYLKADNTLISRAQFEAFSELNNSVLIIYQSNDLQNWWNKLSVAWKTIFNQVMGWNQELAPDSDKLHQLILLHTMEIKENRNIENLEPVKQLVHLRVLKLNDTKISDVTPLQQLRHLQEADLSRNPITNLLPLSALTNLEFVYLNNTPIDNLEWLSGLTKLRILDISGTEVKNLKELSNTIHLEKLIAYNTRINSIKPLETLPELILLKIYNTRVSSKKVAAFKESNPACDVDFY